MKKKIIAASFILVLGSGLLFGPFIFASESNQSKIQSKTHSVKYNIDLQHVSKDIEQIKNSGFDIVLPKQVPENAKYAIHTTKKEFKHGTELTLTQLGDDNDKKENKWKVQILQEKLPKGHTKEKVMQVMAERNASKNVKKINIGGYQALIDYTSDKGEALNEIWIATDHYFYSIGAPFLTREELIDIASSMDFE